LALITPHKLRWHTLPCLAGSWPKFLRSAYPWGGCRPCSFTGSSYAPSWNKFLPTISSLFSRCYREIVKEYLSSSSAWLAVLKRFTRCVKRIPASIAEQICGC